jgi:RNA polymerase subunit RPABC4/transcription elongation factor Spt4
MVICDRCNNSVKPTANYCPECGSELNPTRKDWSDGFLSLVDRGHIQEAIDGNETLPEGYHTRLHETVRHALADFCLLNRWAEFDNHEALYGDIQDEEITTDNVDELEKLVRLTCPFRFLINATGVNTLESVLEASILFASDDSELTLDDIDVSIEVTGDGE